MAVFDAKSYMLLLSAIVFETGYNMKTKGIFFKNIGTIIIYAVFDATVSTLLTGGHFMQVWRSIPLVGSLGVQHFHGK